jgi:5-methylcytosine-specific restriction endonuclease McrA
MGRGGVYVRRFGVYRHGDKPKSCLTCSKAIKPTRQQMNALRLWPASNAACFCSRECALKWRKCESGRQHKCDKCNRKTGWRKGGHPVCEQCRCAPAADVVCNCKQCGREFAKRPHDPKQYCSSQCWGNWKKERRRTNCKKCGVSFIPKKSKNGTYCSRECSGKGQIGRGTTYQAKAKRKSSQLIRLLNRRAVGDEQAWAAEQPKLCKCGRPVSEGMHCKRCRRRKRLDLKKRQNQRYKDFHKSGVREQVIVRDGGVCQYCSRRPRKPTVDHMQPVSLGGTNDMSNLVVACRRCNSIKCNRMPLDLFNWPKWIAWERQRVVNKRQGTLFQ